MKANIIKLPNSFSPRNNASPQQRGRRCRLLASLALLLSLNACVVWPHATSNYEVRGVVLDNRTLRPVKDVDVEVHFPETRETEETKSTKNGTFRVESDGQLNWILYFWGDELIDVPLEMSLKHPRYDAEHVEDLTVRETRKGRFLNVGSVYLDRKR